MSLYISVYTQFFCIILSLCNPPELFLFNNNYPVFNVNALFIYIHKVVNSLTDF